MSKPPSAADAAAFDQARRLFAPLGDIVVRRMFGGAGVYVDGAMFALIADGEIYLKASPETAPAFAAAGCRPFEWLSPGRDVPVRMSYWSLPDAARDDATAAVDWGSRALAAARAQRPASRRQPSVSLRKR